MCVNQYLKIIQVDIQPEEFGSNVKSCVNLFGDIKLVLNQLNAAVKQNNWKFSENAWKDALQKKIQENKISSEKLLNAKELPLQYYSAYNTIKQYLPADYILIGEGANTMDIGRTILNHSEPKKRLDAGTFGTMGIGFPFVLAAKAVHPDKQVVAILGDSAFGFSAMEIDTAVRYNLPFVCIIINNNGIYNGVSELPKDNQEIPVTALNPVSRYEKLADAFGGDGYYVENFEQLHSSLQQAFKNKTRVSIINVMIDPLGVRKPQENDWLTRKDPNASAKL